MKVFMFIVFFIIGLILYRAIDNAINKTKYAKEYLVYEDFLKYAEGIYNDYLDMFNDKSFPEKGRKKIFSSIDSESSRHNFIKLVNFIFFGPFIDKGITKIKLNSDNIELFRKWFNSIKSIESEELDATIGKFYISIPILLHYYDEERIHTDKNGKILKREILDGYFKSIKNSAFDKIRLHDYSEIDYNMPDKITDKYYEVSKRCFDNYHCRYTFDFVSSIVVQTWKVSEDANIMKYNSIEEFELKARNLDIVGDVKGFEDIISDNKKISLAFVNDLKMSNFNSKFCKILMYYDIERHRIEFRDYVKDSQDEHYHTTKRYNNTHNLDMIKYIMYLCSGFFTLYIKIDKEEENGNVIED